MSRQSYGSLTSAGIKRQPGAELAYDDTGLVEGQIVYAVDSGAWASAVALLGTAHPDDENVTLYRLRRRFNTLGIQEAVFDCIGLSKDPTDRVVSFPASTSTEPIETHPDFATASMAGTPDDPQNGAVFTFDDDGNPTSFAGFNKDDAPDELRGVRSYFTSTIICRATYYTRTPPRFSALGKIVGSLPNIPDIGGVVNWLQLAPSSEQIGTARLWRVTEEFLGSGPNGWSEIIYGQ